MYVYDVVYYLNSLNSICQTTVNKLEVEITHLSYHTQHIIIIVMLVITVYSHHTKANKKTTYLEANFSCS